MNTALLLIGLPLGVLWYLFRPISVLTACREPGTDCFTPLRVPTKRFEVYRKVLRHQRLDKHDRAVM